MLSEKKISELYKAHSHELYVYIIRFTGSPESAEDILHDSFANLIDYSKTREIDNARAFLYRTAHNLSLNFIRTASTRKTVPVEDTGEIATEDTGIQRLETDELNNRLYQILESADDFSRSLFVMRKENKLSLKEIAHITGKSERTIRRKLNWLTEHIFSILEKEGYLD